MTLVCEFQFRIMDAQYGIAVKNRYETFIDDDVDPFEILKQQEEAATKLKEKASKDAKSDKSKTKAAKAKQNKNKAQSQNVPEPKVNDQNQNKKEGELSFQDMTRQCWQPFYIRCKIQGIAS